MLDALEGKAAPADSDRPENWLCSLTEAVNPGMETTLDEGLSRVVINGRAYVLRELIAEAPKHYLGAEHYKKHGLQTGFLAKLLDSSMRLHLQAHPTREFARRELGKPWGKFECYVILAVRAGIEPYIYLGFQHPPTPEEWLRIVTEQDMDAMRSCFEKVPVRVGEVWYVPGGLPHALGEGLTVLEVLEPSDLVVRCEFEREGVIVPPGARFMGQNPADALRIFDYTAWPLDVVQAHFRVAPDLLAATKYMKEQKRLGSEQIDCFEVRELEAGLAVDYDLKGRFALGILAAGKGSILCGDEELTLRKGTCFVLAAAAGQVRIEPAVGQVLQILLCLPGAA